jgi:hypothetical protein
MIECNRMPVSMKIKVEIGMRITITTGLSSNCNNEKQQWKVAAI